MRERAGRVALVHDFLVDVRGAERVFAALCALFPQADLFTAVHDPRGTRGMFADRDVHTTYLQRLHPTARTFRMLLPLYPAAIESLDLRGYELVISSSSAWAHGVLVDEGATHICYCHNPFRYAWNSHETALAGRGALAQLVLAQIFSRWRQWDWYAAQRVDRYLANSQATRRRIERCFGRDADVVYPPVDIGRFAPARAVGDRYVVLSELMRHKRIAVTIEAFNRLRLPLTVIGDGPDARRLRRIAGPTIAFTGRLDDARVAEVLAGSRALVVAATEEFGIAAVEAQAAGRPVIALRQGGVCETVLEGVTGAFFDEPSPDALADAVRAFDALAVDPAACVENAQRFAAGRFAEGIRRAVERDPAPRQAARRHYTPARPRGLARRR